jgi:hypothetical protein
MRVHWSIRGGAVAALAILGLLGHAAVVQAGPYLDPGVPGFVADPGNPGTNLLNPELRIWAGAVESYLPSPGVNAANGDSSKALGAIASTADGGTVSLGDLTADELAGPSPLAPGEITVRMTQPLRNGSGWDLAVFENAFAFFPPDDDKVFAELAYVEVSTDGQSFARFPAVSLTTTLFEPFGASFAGIDPTDVHNLAGRHQGLIGTPFDLSELSADPLVASGAVQLDNVNFVRFVGIPANGSSLDSLGNGILAAWPTTDLTFGNGGFDLDAVAGRYPVPEPTTLALLASASLALAARRLRRKVR